MAVDQTATEAVVGGILVNPILAASGRRAGSRWVKLEVMGRNVGRRKADKEALLRGLPRQGNPGGIG